LIAEMRELCEARGPESCDICAGWTSPLLPMRRSASQQKFSDGPAPTSRTCRALQDVEP
jgi:hypothetical protein